MNKHWASSGTLPYFCKDEEEEEEDGGEEEEEDPVGSGRPSAAASPATWNNKLPGTVEAPKIHER